MERYEKYKDSGVEWIGEIPEGWYIEKLKYIADAHPSNIDKKSIDGEETVFLCNYVDVYNNEYIDSSLSFMKATANQDKIQKFILKKDDVIATKDSETPDDIGNPALVIENLDNVVCGYHLTHIKPKAISGRYLFRYFQTKYLRSYFEVSANGITRYGLGVDKFNSALILNPPQGQQTAIANYLDRKTAEIDKLIAQKERLIELYEEERTAIINQAVTKGIDPDVRLKDSGIEWLGEIPEGWEVKKLKYMADARPSNIDKKTRDDEDIVFLCNYVDVYNNEYIDSSLSFMKATANKDQIEKFILKKDDVIATKDSETPDDIGNPALVVENLDNVVCGYHLTHIKPKAISGKYLFRYFQTKYLNSYFEVSANGITRYGLGVDKFNSALILVPSISDQTAIIQYIETETARINAKIAKTKKIITLQKEYRTALISEVVTGKIKVTKETTP